MNNFWTLVRFEWKKIWSRKITWIAFLLVFLTMLAFGFYRAFVSHEVDGVRVTAHEEEMQQKAAAKKIAGRVINDELVEETLQSMGTERYETYRLFNNDIIRSLADIGSFYTIEEVKKAYSIAPEEEFIYTMRRRVIEEGMEGQYLTEGEKEYWRTVLDEKESTPWIYEYNEGPSFAWVGVYTCIVFIALMLAVSLANLFADEHQKKTDQLVLCSRNGKHVLYGAKITAGMLFTLVSAGLVLLVTMVPQLIMFGTDGLDAPIQILLPRSMVQMTMGEMLVYAYLLAVVASLMYSAIIMCCSELFRNSTVAVMALITVLVLVPMMVVIPYEYRVLSQIFELNPINVLAIWSATEYRLVPFFGTYLTVHQVAPVLYTVLAEAFLLVGSRAYLKYQVSGR